MRINVYSQELTKEVKLVEKVSSDGKTHYGIRLFLASPDILHHTPDDDDRSAVTFWVPNCGSFSPQDLKGVFWLMACKAANVSMRMERERKLP
jgi:hypothetical protein